MEFSDYTRVPSKADRAKISQLLEKRAPILGYTHRKLVDANNPKSRQAALISFTSPSARWDVHDQMTNLEGRLSDANMQRIAAQVKFNPRDTSRQEALLKRDLIVASQFGVQESPTYFLLSFGDKQRVYGPIRLDQVDWMTARGIR